MSQAYELEKWIWTEADFEVMGWHDARIHALAFMSDDVELIFDIDYILQWVCPQPEEGRCYFWIAAAALIFENVYDVDFDIELCNGGLDIDVIRSEDGHPPHHKWIIECQEGEVKFHASGYKQFIRTIPTFEPTQTLDLKSRGFSFARGRTD